MRYQVLMTALTLSLGIWACRERDDVDVDTSTVAFDTGMATATERPKEEGPRDTAAAPAASPDGDILGSFIAANRHGVTEGRRAVQQGGMKEVRDLGTVFVRDHDDLIQRANELSNKLGIKPSSAHDPTVQLHGSDAATQGKTGVEYDRAFLQHQHEYHQALTDAVNTMLSKATNEELKTFLQQTLPTYQAHLKGVQDLRAKLPK